MANTGKKIVLTLKQVYEQSQTPTGLVKNNVVGDADYIAPAEDEDSCPVTYGTTCPQAVVTGGDNQVEYEFGFLNSVLGNPDIAKIDIRLVDTGVVIDNTIITLPHSNYVHGYFNPSPGTYQINVVYLDESDSTVAACNAVATISVI